MEIIHDINKYLKFKKLLTEFFKNSKNNRIGKFNSTFPEFLKKEINMDLKIEKEVSIILQTADSLPAIFAVCGYCEKVSKQIMIISNDEIYLIDFLDSYIDTPIIDISKLLQEFDLNWSNRTAENENAITLLQEKDLQLQAQITTNSNDIYAMKNVDINFDSHFNQVNGRIDAIDIDIS